MLYGTDTIIFLTMNLEIRLELKLCAETLTFL